MKYYFLILILSYVFSQTNAQVIPQWKFYIAFEDNTGARDTLWCIWDTLATSSGVDTIFDEQAVQLDDSKFNVYIFNQNGDTAKTSALDSLGSHQLLIEAMNYEHPIQITWDSTLLHQNLSFLPTGFANYARIQNDYFFLINNCPSCQQYDMWIDNYAYGPWYPFASQTQFPMSIYVISDPSIGYLEHTDQKSAVLYPNPFEKYVTIQTNELIRSWEIFSLQSEIVLQDNKFMRTGGKIDLSKLNHGMYILKLYTSSKYPETFKLLKM